MTTQPGIPLSELKDKEGKSAWPEVISKKHLADIVMDIIEDSDSIYMKDWQPQNIAELVTGLADEIQAIYITKRLTVDVEALAQQAMMADYPNTDLKVRSLPETLGRRYWRIAERLADMLQVFIRLDEGDDQCH